MTTDLKGLSGRLAATTGVTETELASMAEAARIAAAHYRPLLIEANRALEATAGEVENQKCFAVTEQQRAELAEAERDRLAGEVETAKSQFKALQMVTSKEHEDTRAERDRLKNALRKKLSAKARQKLGDLSESMIAMGDGHSLEMLLNWYDESRKALGGDA